MMTSERLVVPARMADASSISAMNVLKPLTDLRVVDVGVVVAGGGESEECGAGRTQSG